MGAVLYFRASFILAAVLVIHSEKELAERSVSGLDVDLTHLYSRYAVLIDCDSGIYLAEHDVRAKIYPISSLLRYALQSQTFRDGFMGSRYRVAPTEKHPHGFTFVSTMFPYMDSAEVIGGRIPGGKTGYTEEAGQCLASLAEIGGKEYILVTAKAEGTHETEPFHILDAQNVYNQIGTSVGTGIAGMGGTKNRKLVEG